MPWHGTPNGTTPSDNPLSLVSLNHLQKAENRLRHRYRSKFTALAGIMLSAEAEYTACEYE